MKHPAAPVYVYFSCEEKQAELFAQRGSAQRCWRWRDALQAIPALKQFLEWAGEGPFFSYKARALLELLSTPSLRSHARLALRKFTDLMDGALIAAAEAPRFELRALARHLGLSAEETAQNPVAILPALQEALCQRFAQLPRRLLVLLDYVRGAETALSWLPWPEWEIDERRAAFAQLGYLAPARTRLAASSGEALFGDVPELVEELFGPQGALAQAHPHYEERPPQIAMARSVAEALEEGGVLIIEAGTGVGKSLAYLAPAILWARRHEEPVVISTNTRHLQEQLWAHDLPLLARTLPVSFRPALLKGRANYLCLRALSWLVEETAPSLFWAERLAVMHLLAWLAASPHGDLESISPDALAHLEMLNMAVERVRSRREMCAGRRCPYFSVCLVEQARAISRSADIVILNHALVFADAQESILPSYSCIIFDEAHNLEAVATESFSLELSSPLLAHFARTTGLEGRWGALESIRRRLASAAAEALPPSEREMLQEQGQQLQEYAARLLDAGETLGEELFEFVSRHVPPERELERQALRLTPEICQEESFRGIQEAGEAFITQAQLCHEAFQQFGETLEEIGEQGVAALEGLGAQAFAIAEQAALLQQAPEAILQKLAGAENYVRWAEIWEGPHGPSWALRAAPVEVGPLFQELLYETKKALIFTSATLSVNGDFQHFKRRLGLTLEPQRVREASYPASFDLKRQLLLCIPTDFPDPRNLHFDEAVTHAIAAICQISRGGALVLYTARSRMQKAFEALRDSLEAMGLRPLCQDLSGPRWQLLNQLQQHNNTVLFGLKSFWEGVDVPGEALRCVIIAKLPFAVPDDPLIAARQEYVKQQGGHPYKDFYIPEAIVGFKQGLGRLIRAHSDRGVVFVLDPRLQTRPYGRQFLASIPSCAIFRGPLEDCLDKAAIWLKEALAR